MVSTYITKKISPSLENLHIVHILFIFKCLNNIINNIKDMNLNPNIM